MISLITIQNALCQTRSYKSRSKHTLQRIKIQTRIQKYRHNSLLYHTRTHTVSYDKSIICTSIYAQTLLYQHLTYDPLYIFSRQVFYLYMEQDICISESCPLYVLRIYSKHHKSRYAFDIIHIYHSVTCVYMLNASPPDKLHSLKGLCSHVISENLLITTGRMAAPSPDSWLHTQSLDEGNLDTQRSIRYSHILNDDRKANKSK